MSLEHAILGFLQYKPMSGYDLKKIFDTSVQHFWPADQSQIYRTLNRLADRNWVENEIVPQEDRPDRKLYYITQAGKEELTQWLATPQPREDHRSAALIQVFFAAQLDDEHVLEIFERRANMIRQGLAHFDAIPEQALRYAEDVNSAREVYFWMLTLDAGVTAARAQLAWLERVIDDIRSGAVPPPGAPFTGYSPRNLASGAGRTDQFDSQPSQQDRRQA